jgi:putative hydrolase of the HAD superfamily
MTIAPDFAHIDTWVFDLDNTLYPPRHRLFDQIEVKMTDWVMQALSVDRTRANHLRQHYWDLYGTTLAGLMAEHQIDPAPYLHEVHKIDFAELPRDETLAAHIAALPGRKIIFTNATVPYAHDVLAARGLSGLFDAYYGVEDAGFHPKPQAQSYATIFGRDGLNPTRAAMFEDDPRNLVVPHQLGLRTVHIAPDPLPAPHIHHHASDLTEFLGRLLG